MEDIFELVFPKTYLMIYKNINGWTEIIELVSVMLIKFQVDSSYFIGFLFKWFNLFKWTMTIQDGT